MAIRDEKTKVTLKEGDLILMYTKGLNEDSIQLCGRCILELTMQNMFDLAVLVEEYMHDWNKCKEEQLRNAAEEVPPTTSEEKEE